MDNERPIEKLLRRFAKRRREDSGKPMQLHPATRRLLQGEVARQFPRHKAEGSTSARESAGWWPRWAYALSVLAVVAVLSSLLLPGLGKAKSRSQMAGTMNNLKQVGLAAHTFAEDNSNRLPVTLGEMSNELGAGSLALKDASGKSFEYVAGGKSLDELSPGAVLAYSQPADGRSAVLLADGSVQLMSTQQFAGILNGSSAGASAKLASLRPDKSKSAEEERLAMADKPAEVAMARQKDATATRWPEADRTIVASTPPPATTSPTIALASPAATPALASDRKEAIAGDVSYSDSGVLTTNVIASSGARYANTMGLEKVRQASSEMDKEINEPARFQNFQKTPAKTAILDSFEVVQRGDQLSVIDQDGSTYAGNLILPVNEAKSETMLEQGKKAGNGAYASKAVAAPASLARDAKQDLLSQNLAFRVLGTNRTLNQRVVFEGNFMPTNNVIANQSAGQAQQQIQNFQYFINNSVIVGRAQVENNKDIEINAAPVRP
jgi:hypothetical protein